MVKTIPRDKHMEQTVIRCVNHTEIRLGYGIKAQGSAQISRKATLVDRR